MALFLLFFVILWAFLVIGFWKLVRFLVYRTGRRPAVFVRPWLRRTAITLLFLIPFSGAIFNVLTFEYACLKWSGEVVSKPRQADGFEGYIFGQIDMIADGAFEYIDLPSQENALRIFLADEGDAACSYIFTETDWQPYDLPDAPPGQCFAAKHVPLGSARYGISNIPKFFKEMLPGRTFSVYETTIYDRENEEIIGLYRELMDHKPSSFIRPFLDDKDFRVCDDGRVGYDGIVRTLAPHSGKGGAV